MLLFVNTLKGGITTENEIIVSVIIAALSGPGLVGLMFWFVKRKLENRFNIEAQRQASRNEHFVEREKALSELRQAQGRVLFWLKKSVKDNYVNGELDKAYEHYEQVEEHIKDLDRDIIAQNRL